MREKTRWACNKPIGVLAKRLLELDAEPDEILNLVMECTKPKGDSIYVNDVEEQFKISSSKVGLKADLVMEEDGSIRWYAFSERSDTILRTEYIDRKFMGVRFLDKVDPNPLIESIEKEEPRKPSKLKARIQKCL